MRNRAYLVAGLALVGLLATGPTARAQVLIERTVNANALVPDGGSFRSSVLTWTDANLVDISWTAVTLNFSSGSTTSPMVLGDLSSTLRFGTSTEGFTTATVFSRGGLTNASQTFTMADNFDGAWKSSGRWELRVTDSVAGGVAKLDSWKLSVRGQANSNSAIVLQTGEKISTADDGAATTTVASALAFGANTVSAEALAGKVLTFAGGISGSGTLLTTATNGGKVVLSGNSTNFTGTVQVAGTGATEIADARALGSGELYQSNSQSKLRLNFTGTLTNRLSVFNVAFDTNGATLAGQVTVNNADFDVASNDTNTVSGFVDGSGTVTKLGGGTLVLSGTTNIYSGITDVRNGTLRAATVANSGTSSSIGTGTNLTIGSSSNAGTFVFTASSTTNSMNREVLVGSAGGTFSVEQSSSRVNLTGSVANQTGGSTNTTLTKAGAGTLVLSGGSGSVTVSTIAVQQGTLLLGAANTIANTTGITLAGGTFDTGGFADAVGRLLITASSSIKGMNAAGDFVFSEIDLSSYAGGGSSLSFIGSYARGDFIRLASTNFTGWSGYTEASMNSFLSKVQFGNPGLKAGAISFDGGFATLSVIPEPKVYVAAGILVVLIGYTEYRRRRRLCRK